MRYSSIYKEDILVQPRLFVDYSNLQCMKSTHQLCILRFIFQANNQFTSMILNLRMTYIVAWSLLAQLSWHSLSIMPCTQMDINIYTKIFLPITPIVNHNANGHQGSLVYRLAASIIALQ